MKKRVVIAGGGTAGWMTAAALAKLLGKNLDISLVESDEIGTVGVGEATIPTLHIYHNLLGLKESEVMAATNATFKLGIQFENWRDLNKHYLHSFGFLGQDCWAAQFHHFWVKGSQQGMVKPIGDYCVEHLAAREGRFAVLPNQAHVNHAYHLDATAYAKFLRMLAEKYGVKRVEGKITDVRLKADNGFIESIQLASDEMLQGDIFVDCTGFRGLLIEETLHTGYDDWSHYLPCDRAIAVQTESDGSLVPYTRSIAHEAGWQWRIPLQTRTGNGMVYCSRYWTEDQAREALIKNLDGKMINEPRVIPFRTGTRRLHWNKNCIAIGLSSGFIEPLESTSIHLIQRSIIKLLLLFPAGEMQEADIQEFNQQMYEELLHIRDFIVLHYKQTERTDTKFWRHCQSMDIPESLRHRIELFRESGRIQLYDRDLFKEASWVQVMMGQGISPKTWHPIVDLMEPGELNNFLETIRQQVQNSVAQYPLHKEFVKKYCPVKMASGKEIDREESAKIYALNLPFRFNVTRVGTTQTPILIADDICSDDGDALRKIAGSCDYVNYSSEYPGVRAELPLVYVAHIKEQIVSILYKTYGIPSGLIPSVKKWDFSLVAESADSLESLQRIPHLDTSYPWLFAVCHYLGKGEHGDTGLFRHNPTGLERVFEADKNRYFQSVNDFGKTHLLKQEYIQGSNEQFTLYHRIPYKTNRLAIYPGNLLHSLLIKPEVDISGDVNTGRLTSNIFIVFQ